MAEALDRENIAVRAGMHCCHPLMNALNLTGIIRASFSVYTDEEDVDRLITALHDIVRSPVATTGITFDPANPCGRFDD